MENGKDKIDRPGLVCTSLDGCSYIIQDVHNDKVTDLTLLSLYDIDRWLIHEHISRSIKEEIEFRKLQYQYLRNANKKHTSYSYFDDMMKFMLMNKKIIFTEYDSPARDDEDDLLSMTTFINFVAIKEYRKYSLKSSLIQAMNVYVTALRLRLRMTEAEHDDSFKKMLNGVYVLSSIESHSSRGNFLSYIEDNMEKSITGAI